MQETPELPTPEDAQRTAVSASRLIGWLCSGVIALSVVSCIIIAAIRSTGLTKITVTALDETIEPRDQTLPFIKQKEALPDYELALILTNGDTVRLGTKPNASAVDGLSWLINDPVSITDVASVRLQDQDTIISDAVAEVQVLGHSTTEKGYRFDFVTERSITVGVKSFFDTPIGIAIAAGFCISILVIVLGSCGLSF